MPAQIIDDSDLINKIRKLPDDRGLIKGGDELYVQWADSPNYYKGVLSQFQGIVGIDKPGDTWGSIDTARHVVKTGRVPLEEKKMSYKEKLSKINKESKKMKEEWFAEKDKNEK